MLNRISSALCHPSRIAMYYKDKMSLAIAHVVIFMALLIGAIFLSNVNESYFNIGDSKYISGMVQRLDNKTDLEFKDQRLTGSSESLKSEYVDIYFLNTAILPENNDKISMYFNELDISIYHGIKKLKSYMYSNLEFEDFKMEAVRERQIGATLAFEQITLSALMSTSSYFLNMESGYRVLGYIISYLFVLLFVGLYSYFTNQDLPMGIRMRICLYCTLIYPFMALLGICFSLDIIELIGLILPMIYCRMAFSRIVRVRVKKI